MGVVGRSGIVSSGDEPESNRAEAVARDLQRRILMGDFAVGSWLRHEALAAEYGTSRTPIREALAVLHAQGVVTIVRNRGARVDGHSARDIRELGQVRAELEGFAAALAAERINDEQTARLRSAWDSFRKETAAFAGAASPHPSGEEFTRWARANEDFHEVVLEAAGNRQLRVSIAEVHGRLPQNTSFAAYAGNARLIRRNLGEHDDIVDAIEAGNSHAAREAMRTHIINSVNATVHWAEQNQLVRE